MPSSLRLTALALALVAGSAGAQGRFDPADLARLADALLRAGRTPEDVRELLRQERDAGDSEASRARFEELLERVTSRPAAGPVDPDDAGDEEDPEAGDSEETPDLDEDASSRPSGMLGDLTGLHGTGALLSPGDRPVLWPRRRKDDEDEDGARRPDDRDRDTAGDDDDEDRDRDDGDGDDDERPPRQPELRPDDLLGRYSQELRDLEDAYAMASALNAGSAEELEPVLGFLEGLDPAGVLRYSTYVDQAIVRLGALSLQGLGDPDPTESRRWRARADALRKARAEARVARNEALQAMALAQQTRGNDEAVTAAREKLAALEVEDPAALRGQAAEAVRTQRKTREARREADREKLQQTHTELGERQSQAWKDALERVRRARERRPADAPEEPAEEPTDQPAEEPTGEPGEAPAPPSDTPPPPGEEPGSTEPPTTEPAEPGAPPTMEDGAEAPTDDDATEPAEDGEDDGAAEPSEEEGDAEGDGEDEGGEATPEE